MSSSKLKIKNSVETSQSYINLTSSKWKYAVFWATLYKVMTCYTFWIRQALGHLFTENVQTLPKISFIVLKNLNLTIRL